MMLLSKSDIEAICSHAVDEYPFECCGIIVGEGNQSKNQVYRCQNIQNQRHRENPEKYPQDAKTAYYMDPKEVQKITKAARENHYEFKAIYHSHPDHDVYFSKEDKDNALFFDEPAFPGVVYVVVSIYNRTVKDIGFFKWDKTERDFNKGAITYEQFK